MMKMMVSVAPAQRCEEVEKHSFSVYGFEPSEKQQQNKRSASTHKLSVYSCAQTFTGSAKCSLFIIQNIFHKWLIYSVLPM